MTPTPADAEQRQDETFTDVAHGAIKIVGQEANGSGKPHAATETSMRESFKDPMKRQSTVSAASNTSSESFFKKSEFLDPLERINQMKFMTSADIRVAHGVKFACLDLRVRKVPRLTEIFKQPVMYSLEQRQRATDFVPVLEIEVTPGQKLNLQ